MYAPRECEEEDEEEEEEIDVMEEGGDRMSDFGQDG